MLAVQAMAVALFADLTGRLSQGKTHGPQSLTD